MVLEITIKDSHTSNKDHISSRIQMTFMASASTRIMAAKTHTVTNNNSSNINKANNSSRVSNRSTMAEKRHTRTVRAMSTHFTIRATSMSSKNFKDRQKNFSLDLVEPTNGELMARIHFLLSKNTWSRCISVNRPNLSRQTTSIETIMIHTDSQKERITVSMSKDVAGRERTPSIPHLKTGMPISVTILWVLSI